MRALIYDVDGSWDMTTLTNVQDEALHLQHTDKLSSAYDSGQAVITEVAAHTYYLKTDTNTNTYQLMHYDGTNDSEADVPVVDNVVKLNFAYFGDPQPPMLLAEQVAMRDASRRAHTRHMARSRRVSEHRRRRHIRQARTARSRSSMAHRSRGCRRSRDPVRSS